VSNLSPQAAIEAAEEAFGRGRLADAERLCRQTLEALPNLAAGWDLLGRLAMRAGRPADAATHFRQALERGGPDVSLYDKLALALAGSDKADQAEIALRQALVLEPDAAVLQAHLGAIYLKQDRWTDAARVLERVLALAPNVANAAADLDRARQRLKLSERQQAELAGWVTAADQPTATANDHARAALGLMRAGRPSEAVRHFEAATRLEPTNAKWYSNLGNLLQMLGQTEDAARAHAEALRLDPQMDSYRAKSDTERAAEAFATAEQSARAGRQRVAIDHLLRTLAWQADHREALSAAGIILQQLGRPAWAYQLTERRLTLEPDSADLLNTLGNLSQELSRPEQAMDYYRRAVAADPKCDPAHRNLGYMLKERGYVTEAREHWQRAWEANPDDMVRVLLVTALPPIYASKEEADRAWHELNERAAELVADRVRLDTTRVCGPTLFYAAYHGLNDCPLQTNMAQVYTAPRLKLSPAGGRGGKIRVGFLSKYFKDHTIGRLNLGMIEQLDRSKFEVAVIAPRPNDQLGERFRRTAQWFVELPSDPDRTRRAIVELGLDILFFADVGMDALTYTLSFSRMAPIQCVTWGHPVTTGSPEMDYFISSTLLESPGGQQYYREQLVELPNLANYYERPQLPPRPRDRESFGFAPGAHLYGCPQTLFKLHPKYDDVLASILRADPQGELVLLDARYEQWSELVRQRFSRSMADVHERVRFLPPLPRPDFLALNAVVDVLLDPTHFGGGNTTYEALALGTPVVSLPSEMLRGRITRALYTKMGVDDCLVATPEEYVALAVRLGTDVDYRRQVSAKILAAADVLYENPQGVRDLEAFFVSAFERQRSGK